MHPKKSALHILVPTAFLLVSASAAAQDAASPGYTEPAPVVYAEPAPQTQLQPPVDIEPADGPRFRFGIDFAGGFERNDHISFWLVGFDVRLGVQLNDLVGIHVTPHLSFGKGDEGGATGTTATFAATVGADFTLFDRVFFGAGFGYGVLNNPSGPVLAFRLGAYPLAGRPNLAVPRRKGMSVGLDLRAYFVGEPQGTVVQMMFSLGYEAF